ncbi:MAG: DnaJ domain-containing protein, partial [Blastocatellia bacterium]|nr:DnaJ domain-containing protein [Blastocatellia bacterium]
MTSLYDLLGARADDDEQAIKKAFRKAVRANHPDLHPDDPDAVLRFRRIITASAILRDPKQRAAYDELLELERQRIKLQLDKQL